MIIQVNPGDDLKAAVTQAQDGDVVRINGGVWTTPIGNIDKPGITIEGDPANMPAFDTPSPASFIRLYTKANRFTLRNINFLRAQFLIWEAYPEHVLLENLHFKDTTKSITIKGGVDVKIFNTSTTHFTKRHIELVDVVGAHIVDAHFDSQLDETDPFAIGIKLDKVVNGLLERCVGANISYKVGSYWNGDVIATEGLCKNIVMRNCGGYNSTDAIFDLKGEVELYDCWGVGAKRIFRVWGDGLLVNCVAVGAKVLGDGMSACALWSGGKARVTNFRDIDCAKRFGMENGGTIEEVAA